MKAGELKVRGRGAGMPAGRCPLTSARICPPTSGTIARLARRAVCSSCPRRSGFEIAPLSRLCPFCRVVAGLDVGGMERIRRKRALHDECQRDSSWRRRAAAAVLNALPWIED